MPFKQNIDKVTRLKNELDSFRPLTPEMENRIMQKFRLDWNYHSSHIEGNQLTYGETKALLLFGQTAQAKPLKDHIEMTGHNEAIKVIEEVIRQERPLTENFIRELHELILKEPYEVDAITPDGRPAKRTIEIGKYKTVPNHVKTRTGEIFYFATPEETPAKMNDLMDWYALNLENNELHPVLFATEFHYKFIRIHPFDDGNGRLARLLMNFILMQKGYPPAIIRTEEKNEYYAALEQADAGQADFFFNYVCQQVIRSLELMIKGAKGEDIEDPDDLDKKIALLEQELAAVDPNEEVKERLNLDLFIRIFHSWLSDLFKTAIPEIQKFNKFFTGINHHISLGNFGSISFSIESPDTIITKLEAQITPENKYFQDHEAKISIHTSYGTFTKGGLNSFGCNYSIYINFDTIKYVVSVDEFKDESKTPRTQVKMYEKLLHKPLTETEIKKVVKQLTNAIFEHIDFYTKKNGIR